MKYYIRVFGWLLLGMGALFGSLGLLLIYGVMEVQIDFWGVEIRTSAQRIYWVVGWSLLAVTGLALLLFTKRFSQQEKGL